jgi:TIR domain
MKVFISHQRGDSVLAGTVAHRLKTYHQIDCYIDLIDPDASKSGDKLGDYLRAQMGLCTQLLAVVSQNTKTSWWVPWEIGISTEKDQPIATYAGDNTSLPEYLRKWPYLRSQSDLDQYARVSKAAEQTLRRERSFKTEARARESSTALFYRELRASLGQ